MPPKQNEKNLIGDPPKAVKLSFEEAMKELEVIVQQMASGELPLEKLVESHEQAMRLVKLCEELLADARERIRFIENNSDGSVKIKAAVTIEETSSEENF